ncbi:hypothetical protein [Aquihabitans sp. McL0605]|uniref:hypothetical protein n=1 Tax=Aquihabitans sp. McL0605 TaxID=3415671 RepID=UPI003CF7F6E5
MRDRDPILGPPPDPWAVEPTVRWAARTARRRGLLMGAALAVGAGPTAVKVWQTGGHRPSDTAVVVVLGLAWLLALSALLGRRAWSLPALAAGGVAAIALTRPFIGTTPAIVTLLATTTAFAALVEWQPIPGWPRRARGIAPLGLAPLILSQLIWVRSGSHAAVALLIVASLVLTELAARRPGWIHAADRSLAELVRIVVTFIGHVALLIVALPLVYLPGAISQLVRRGGRLLPGHRARAATTWRTRGISEEDQRRDARRPFTSTPRSLRASRSALGVVVVLAVVLGLVTWRDHRTSTTTDTAAPATDLGTSGASFTADLTTSDAFADAPWASILGLNLRDYWSLLEFDVSGGWRVANLRSRYINVANGERRTAAPEPSLGDPLDVWLLGGSVAFGAGQRDDRTVASDLVRLAGQDGIPIRVHNLAVPATVNWQSALLFAELLQWQDHPDLAIFLDGENDVTLQVELNGTEQGERAEPGSLLDSEFQKMLASRARPGVADQLGIERDPTGTVPPSTDPTELGDRIATRYGHGVALAHTLAKDAGIATRFYWQPSLLTKADQSAADEKVRKQVGASDADLAAARAVHQTIFDQLPALDVHNLSTAYDGQTKPIYWDQVHTNELGASLLAEALYRDLRPQLQELAR